MSLQSVIEKKTCELTEKLKAKDFKAASTFYTENCVLMPSTGETVVGRNDFVEFSKKSYESCGEHPEVCMKIIDVFADGNLAVSRGNYTFKDGGKASCGSFVNVWKKVNNDYQVQLDIWNECKKPAECQ